MLSNVKVTQNYSIAKNRLKVSSAIEHTKDVNCKKSSKSCQFSNMSCAYHKYNDEYKSSQMILLIQ